MLQITMLHLLCVSGAILEEFFEGNAPQLGAAKGAEWGRVWEGYPSCGVRASTPAGNAFWSILKATEHSFLHLYANALWARPSFGRQLLPLWGAIIAPAPT